MNRVSSWPSSSAVACTVLILSCAVTGAFAEPVQPATQKFDRAWSHATLWKDSTSGDYLALSGRLQLDSYWFAAGRNDVPPNADDTTSDTLWRRFRFGFISSFGGGYTVQIESDLDLNNELGNLYNRLTDAYIGYSPGEVWNVKFLKQSAGYTLDGATSSKKLLTLQRNNLTNNLWATDEYYSGVHVGGVVAGQWRYRVGLFSGDSSEEISLNDVGYFSLLSLGHDFSRSVGMDEATVRIDHVYNEKSEQENADNSTPNFRHTTTLATHWVKGKWGLRTDLSSGQGLGSQRDLWGLVLMPFYSFSKYQQVVWRYTYLTSSGENGLKLGRYEKELVSARGDRYSEGYVGYNLYFYGQKFKWQTGLQYTKMDDAAGDGGEYKGWGLTTGLRMYW